MKKKFNVTGMSCAACSAHVEKSVSKLDGVNEVVVSLMTNSMTVDYDESALIPADIINAVKSGGYGASEFGAQSAAAASAPTQEDEERNMRHRLISSIIILIPLMYVSMHHMFSWYPLPPFLVGAENSLIYAFTQMLLTMPIMYINRKFYINGFKSLFHGAPNMDTLIAVGSGAAFVYGVAAIYAIGYALGRGDLSGAMSWAHDLYFESAAMILTLITVGKYLEARSKGKTSQAISKLMDLSPKTALVERGGEIEEIPLSELHAGDIAVVKAGMSIPADGVVISGSAAVDQSAITGESVPVDKAEGDNVTGGTVSHSGYFRMRVEKTGDDTALAKIIELVQNAVASKAPIAKLADKVSGIFVPVVMTIAVVAFVIWMILGKGVGFSLSIAISVLVISCPCALGLATPTAVMVGTGKGAEYGILIKDAESLETLHKIKTVIMDKTGTVTEGKPSVTDIIPADGISRDTLVNYAVSLERLSDHPLSKAVTAVECGKTLDVTDFTLTSGGGISGTCAGKSLIGGNARLMQSNNISIPAEVGERLAAEGKTPLYFAYDGEYIGIIAVADTVRATSRKAIADFRRMGINPVMLTGDNKRTAEAVGRNLGVKTISDVLPEDKERIVRELSADGLTAMIGDGINDAPALARADVGIAIGAGTDAAIESADVVLMKSDLQDAVTAVQLSKAVIKNIKENLFWAFFYNALGIPVAAGALYGFGIKLNPMIGAAAMSFSSVFVVTNALRLKFFKPSDKYLNNKNNVAETEVISAKKETNDMTKTMKINGMMCMHCAARVEKALGEVAGVSGVKVDLDNKQAIVTLSNAVNDADLTKAVTDAGYEVVGVE